MQYNVYGIVYQRTAWTGGEAPSPVTLMSDRFRRRYNAICCAMYREQLKDWFDYWHDLPDRDTRNVLWGRAIHDAWRTMTDGYLSHTRSM